MSDFLKSMKKIADYRKTEVKLEKKRRIDLTKDVLYSIILKKIEMYSKKGKTWSVVSFYDYYFEDCSLYEMSNNDVNNFMKKITSDPDEKLYGLKYKYNPNKNTLTFYWNHL